MTPQFYSQVSTQKNWKQVLKKYMYTHAHTHTLHNSQKVKTPQMRIN